MKIKIIILLFPIFLFSQNKNENLSEIKVIESRIKFADSISNFIQEEIQNMKIVQSHGRIDGKPIEPAKIQIRILKNSNQILRICYSQSDLKESWKYYYYDSKLIYAESNILRNKKRKRTIKRFYFQDEVLISPSYSDNNYDVEEEVNVFIKGKELFKSNS